MALSIGIRELRQHASRYLRLVEERGEPIEITDRGRPVALLTPLPIGNRIEQLAASGRLRRARGSLRNLGPPLEPEPGAPLPSEVLAALRADERDPQRYLDASALVKLVVQEPQSRALEEWIGGRDDVVSCALARTEVVRATSPSGRGALARARRLLDRIELIQLDDELLDLAGELQGPLRSLDAIHLAAALELGDALEAIVTYDGQMARAAEALGLSVVAPD